MRGGDLRSLVTLQGLVDGQDGIGQPVQTWADVAQVWADVRFLSGLETIKADAQQAITRASVRIRFRSDVTQAMRIVHGSTVLQIKACLPDDTGRKYLDLACEVIA